MKLKSIILTSLFTAFVALPSVNAEASTNELYQLWKDEAVSKSQNPSNLDSFNNGLYTNHHFGYELDVPVSWEIDNHQVPNYTRFFSEDFRLDITFDDTKKHYKTINQYISETTESITPFLVKEGVEKTNSGLDIKIFDYKRSPLPGINQDMTSYSYFFVVSGDNVYTFQLKSSDSLFFEKKQQVVNLIKEGKYFTPKLFDVNNLYNTNTNSPNIEIKSEKRTLVIPPNKVAFGLYQPGLASSITEKETELDTHFGTQMFYKPINKPYDTYVDTMVSNGKVPLVTIHFDYINDNTVTSDNVQKVINGDFDSYINSWAAGIKDTKSPVFVRVGNEMNGSWVSWSHKNSYNDPDLYKLAYRHVVNIFKENGTTNAYFVWNPNDISKPNYSWNQAAMYYPGDTFVDWLGLTAYNFGDTGKDYKYFDDLYEDLYKTYMRSFSGKPMMIGEFASREKGGNKPYFLMDMMSKLNSKYPNIKLVIWFNGEPENELPYDSSLETKLTFKQIVKHDNIISHPITDNVPNGLQIAKPNNSRTTDTYWTFTGVALDSNINSVFLNDEKQTFKWASWRQFDKQFKLKNGENTIKITILKNDGTKEEYNYFIYKDSSFKLSTDAGSLAPYAPIVDKYQTVLTGLVNDKAITNLKINGKDVPIKWSWRQFDSDSILLKHGLNEFVIEGFDNSGNLLTKEIFYMFKDGDLKITSPNQKNSDIYSHKRVITGMAEKSNVKWVKVDGINQTLKWSWRQFDQELSFDYGDNNFYVDGIYEHVNAIGETVFYPIHHKYKIHAPSFDFINYVSYYPSYAGQTSNKNNYVEGLIKDQKVKSLKINGEAVELLYDWKQFKHPVILKNGINSFKLTGYSDENFQNIVAEETVYLFHDGELMVTSLKDTYVNTSNKSITITGMAPSEKIKSVKVNGITQTLKWSWRQFDQVVELPKNGNNLIEVEATYQDIVNGIAYTKVIKKVYTVHTPSFDFQSPLTRFIHTAPQTSNSTEIIKGTVIDSEVKSLRINGDNVTINSDKTFTYSAKLVPGINGIKLTGFSDTNYEKKIFEEVAFIFNDEGFTIDSPATPTSTVESREFKFTGILKYNAYKSLKINGTEATLYYDWRQIAEKVPLNIGENKFTLEAAYESNYEGQPYRYIAKKEYKIIVPDGVSSYEFTTPIGYSELTAPKTPNATEWMGALVKNNAIKSIKVNGTQADIQYSWRQISVPIPLRYGVNAIKLEGYSDSNYQTKIDEQIVYIYRQ